MGSSGGADENAGFVLLHGAGLGGWIWRDVVPALDAPALAVEFPARDASSEVRKSLSFDDYIRSISAQVDEFAPAKLVIVAHSIAGVLAPAVMDPLKDRVAGFAAVGATIADDGGSFLSSLPLPRRIAMRVILRLLGTRPPAGAIRKVLCNDLDATTSDEVVDRFTEESRALYSTPVGANLLRVPSMYVQLDADAESSPSFQRSMASRVPDASVVSLESGHLPMLSRPAELAQVLNSFLESLATDAEPGPR